MHRQGRNLKVVEAPSNFHKVELQPPQAKRIKLHTNRTEINKDGLIEFFGVAQPPFGNIAIAFIQVDGIKWRV